MAVHSRQQPCIHQNSHFSWTRKGIGNEWLVFDSSSEQDFGSTLGRLVSHTATASEQNVSAEVIDVSGSPHLFFRAKRNIEIGEELAYDYGDKRKDVLLANPWMKPSANKRTPPAAITRDVAVFVQEEWMDKESEVEVLEGSS